MKYIMIPYGDAGWTEKNRIMEGVLSSRPGPPFIYNEVLILVSSSRMKRMYGNLFLKLVEQQGSAALVQPEVQTLHQFVQKLSDRIPGPRLMDENSRLVLLEGLVKERLRGDFQFNQSPDLLAPSLSAALAKMIEQLSAAGVTPQDLVLKINGADFCDKPQVRLLVDVYGRYMNVLEKRALTDPAGMRLTILNRFDASWIAPYREIIIDGIQDAGTLEAGILRKVAESGKCTCLIEAPSAESVEHAGEFHPLRITKDFLSQFGTTAGTTATAVNSDDLFLSRALFSEKPFHDAITNAPGLSSFSKKLGLLSAINTREEVSLIAGRVKRSLRSGMAPEAILVAFPALEEYGPLVEEIFNDYGIPYNRALGRQLSSSPVATAVVSLLRACQEDFSGPSLIRVLSSAFLKFSENKAIAPALDRLMRDARILGGRERVLSALTYRVPAEDGGDILTGPLRDLFSALEPFCAKDPTTLYQWMERLTTLLAWSELGARVDLIHGPLNINLQAYRKLTETLASLSRAGKLFPEYSYTFNEWLFLLKKTFMHTRFQVPPEDEGGVQILGLEESMGHPWKEIYLGGLVDNTFPQRLPQNIFLPERTLETMGVRTLEKARLTAAYHFYRILLSAEKVTLTYPENEGDRPTVPSPFLRELGPLREAGLLTTSSGIQFSLKIEESNSLPELAKAIGLAGDRTGLTDRIPATIDGIAGIRSAVADVPPETTPALPPQLKSEFRVTELDRYLTCPYDYFVRYILRLEPLEEVTEDISPLDRGSKVHAILRNFYLSWKKPVTREDRKEAQELLRDLAASAFDKDADTVRNRREKNIFLDVMAERFLDAEEAFWKQGMLPEFLEQKIESFTLPLSHGELVTIRGTIDRIDVDGNGNFVIVDYKTGNYPLPKMTPDQDIFQLPVYAVMARTALRGKGPLITNPIGLAYYDLAGKTGAGARDVVLFNKEARDDHPSSKPKASPKSAAEFETILKQSIDKARKAVEGILAGEFPSTPKDENKCRFCPNEMLCEKEEL